jgi:ABC-2 type transport system ATP-binding protein
MTELIRTHKLVKKFGDITAVDRVSLGVSRGEVLGFLGPNGAGKSTTMRMIAGFLLPTEGDAFVAGHSVVEDPVAVKRSLGYLAEGAPLYADMSVKSFLEFIAEVRGYKGSGIKKHVDRALDLTDLGSMRERTIETLSKGYKRRVGLAQALLHDPEVLILDEPTDGLDPNQKFEVRKLIQSMAASKAIIISTHILEEVESLCTRAVIIAEGRIVADGTPKELESRSAYHNSIHLTLPEKSLPEAMSALKALKNIERIEQVPAEKNQGKLIIIPKASKSLIAEVSLLVHERSLPVQEMRQEHGQLDEVFRQITTHSK